MLPLNSHLRNINVVNFKRRKKSWVWSTPYMFWRDIVNASNLSMYLVYYAELCTGNQYVEPISTSLRLSNTALFEEMLQRWQAVG